MGPRPGQRSDTKVATAISLRDDVVSANEALIAGDSVAPAISLQKVEQLRLDTAIRLFKAIERQACLPTVTSSS